MVDAEASAGRAVSAAQGVRKREKERERREEGGERREEIT